MSSAAVREILGAAIAQALPAPWVVLPVANLIPEPRRNQRWAAVRFVASGNGRISLGPAARWRETGSAEITLNVPAGDGFEAAIEAAEALAQVLAGWCSNDGFLRVVEVMPPQEVASGDIEGSFAAMLVAVFYEFDHTGGRNGN